MLAGFGSHAFYRSRHSNVASHLVKAWLNRGWSW
jgi:hypothetical protein